MGNITARNGGGGGVPRVPQGLRHTYSLPLIVCQCNALGRDLEVDDGWGGPGAAAQSCRAGPGHRLGARQ